MRSAGVASHSSWRVVASTAVTLTLFFGAFGASAEPTSLVRLSFSRGSGADTCIDEPRLEELVRGRLGRDPFSSRADVSIEGNAVRVEGTWRAVLDVRDRRGHALGHRELEAHDADCGPLGDALVLAVALTIDPEAGTTSLFPTSPEPAPASSSLPAPGASTAPVAPAAPVVAAAAPPVVAAPASSSVTSSDATTTAPVAASCPECAPREVHGDIVVAAEGGAAFGFFPKAAPVANVTALAGRGKVHGALSMSFLPEQAEGSLALGLTFVGVGGCYDAFTVRSVVATACAEVQAGAIHAVVRDLTPLHPGDQLWLAAAIGPRFAWTFLPPLRLDVAISAVIPLVRKSFGVEGERSPLFREAAVGAVSYAGLGVDIF